MERWKNNGIERSRPEGQRVVLFKLTSLQLPVDGRGVIVIGGKVTTESSHAAAYDRTNHGKRIPSLSSSSNIAKLKKP